MIRVKVKIDADIGHIEKEKRCSILSYDPHKFELGKISHY